MSLPWPQRTKKPAIGNSPTLSGSRSFEHHKFLAASQCSGLVVGKPSSAAADDPRAEVATDKAGMGA